MFSMRDESEYTPPGGASLAGGALCFLGCGIGTTACGASPTVALVAAFAGAVTPSLGVLGMFAFGPRIQECMKDPEKDRLIEGETRDLHSHGQN